MRAQSYQGQTSRENRQHKDSYDQYLETLLAADKLFTWDEFTALWDIEVKGNPDAGKPLGLSARQNKGRNNLSKTTGFPTGFGYKIRPSDDIDTESVETPIETVIATFNAQSIEFHGGPVPYSMKKAEFPAFAAANSYLVDEEKVRTDLRGVASYLENHPDARIRVVGSSNYQVEGLAVVMGLARAETIARILIDYGVSSDQCPPEGIEIDIGGSPGVGVQIILVK